MNFQGWRARIMAEDLIMEVCSVLFAIFSSEIACPQTEADWGWPRRSDGTFVVEIGGGLEAPSRKLSYLSVHFDIWVASPKHLSKSHHDQAGKDLHIKGLLSIKSKILWFEVRMRWSKVSLEKKNSMARVLNGIWKIGDTQWEWCNAKMPLIWNQMSFLPDVTVQTAKKARLNRLFFEEFDEGVNSKIAAM